MLWSEALYHKYFCSFSLEIVMLHILTHRIQEQLFSPYPGLSPYSTSVSSVNVRFREKTHQEHKKVQYGPCLVQPHVSSRASQATFLGFSASLTFSHTVGSFVLHLGR